MLSKTDPILFEMCKELTTKQVHIDKPTTFTAIRMMSMLLINEGKKSNMFDEQSIIETMDILIEAMAFITIAHEQTEYIQEHINRKEVFHV